MGVFSWLDCQTGEQILIDCHRNVYLLIPKEFGGGHITEPCYDGYGTFGNRDVYEQVADWNRQIIPEILKKCAMNSWTCTLSRWEKTLLENFYYGKPINDGMDSEFEKRQIGIIMACANKDNLKMRYPIKITYDPRAVYEDCKPSLGDPAQGLSE